MCRSSTPTGRTSLTPVATPIPNLPECVDVTEGCRTCEGHASSEDIPLFENVKSGVRPITPPLVPRPDVPRPRRRSKEACVAQDAEELRHKVQVSAPRRRISGSAANGRVCQSRAASVDHPARKSGRKSKSPAPRRLVSSSPAPHLRRRAELDEDDYRFLSDLFSASAVEFEEGQPVMNAPEFQGFLESFIGAQKHAAIQAGMLSISVRMGEQGGTDRQHNGSKQLHCVMKDIEAAMQPGALKDIVSARHFACCGNAPLLAKALKSVGSLPPPEKRFRAWVP